MATWQQLREGMSRAWDSLVDGWHQLFHRASGAITRFIPRTGKGESTAEEREEMIRRSSGWGVLAAEVADDDKKVVVRLEVPGLEPDEIDLQVIDNTLVVRGEKRMQREQNDSRFHVIECAYGLFERAIPLPEEVNADKAKATYRHGVLRVEMPKLKTGKRTTIKVKID